MKYKSDRTLILAHVGFSDDKPDLLINDVYGQAQEHFSPLGKTFSLKKLPKRYCVGSFDLEAQKRSACALGVELPAGLKETNCPTCRDITGFNPAFYNTPVLSPQQRAYNATPHFVYLAYFSPTAVKAGISAEMRGIRRLLEQGARAALILGRYPNADEARDLEARLCSFPEISETMRSSRKADLLVETRYDFDEASQVLTETARKFGLGIPEPCLDLDPYYFEGFAPSSDELQIPGDGVDDVCGGYCIGMAGPLLVFEQEGIGYVTSVREWESHRIEIYLDEVIHTYDFEPMQMSLL